jgi:hypothetical protein
LARKRRRKASLILNCSVQNAHAMALQNSTQVCPKERGADNWQESRQITEFKTPTYGVVSLQAF